MAILRGTCFLCHRLMVPTVAAHLFMKKMQLLDHGLIPMIGQLEEFTGHLLQEAKASGLHEGSVIDQITQMTDQILTDSGDQRLNVKNIEAAKNRTRNDIISMFFTTTGKCPHCKERKRILRQEYNSKLLLQGSKAKTTPSKDKSNRKEKESSRHSRRSAQNEYEDNDMETEPADFIMETVTPESVIQSNQSLDVDEDSNDVPEERHAIKKTDQTILTPSQTQEHLRQVWNTDGAMLKRLYGSLSKTSSDHPTDIFFLETIPVPPSRFRPISRMNDRMFENPQTANLCKLLVDSANIRQLLMLIDKDTTTEETVLPSIVSEITGTTVHEKIQNAWVLLQSHVNCSVDSDLDKISKEKHPGIKQLLEKKEGLFRKHMMGKRVNYAARSVISPDPCISTNEIGIPEVFAKKLTYPQPVTPWNIQELRQAVINGPDTHPGANFVENEDGHKILLSSKNTTQREAVAKQLLTPSTNPLSYRECKKVYRHLKNGDILLLNRQPTLHKPSIQAHKARVLQREKTLRLHYANCKAYNADFDGDEMNAHFPQNELARAEAYTISSTDFQYLVPKDGSPLAGLIQDHMISGVHLMIRGRFFNRQDYCHLVFTALVDKVGPVITLPPTIIKPCRLWSGKQVLSTVLLNNLPEGKKPLNLSGKSKIPEKSWTKESGPLRNWLNVDWIKNSAYMGESTVIIRGGELLCGVLDKGHYGPTPYGLIHCCYELYGGDVAGRLLTCLGRLFMNFLQMRGFTLGVEDILVKSKANKSRKTAVDASKRCGPEAAAEALSVEDKEDEDELITAFKQAHFSPTDKQLREMDLSMKGQTDDIQNEIARACMPKGLHKLFPDNNLQLMVQSGAKGSTVNCMQISCLLGQIELEGRRPPLMLSGKSLPPFLPYDTSPRAGGFVTGRFLTGIRPQEYFFHCMAGREGLIDTAVKTSRSGYLQRCLIKHLEGVIVNYDLTVRDSDGSIIQFYYGEDGMDISKTGFLGPKQFPFWLDNKHIMKEQQNEDRKLDLSQKDVKKWINRIAKWRKRNKGTDNKERKSGFLNYCKSLTDITDAEKREITNTGRSSLSCRQCQAWQDMEQKSKKKYSKYRGPCPDPILSKFKPYQQRGILSEKMADIIQKFTKKDLSSLNTAVEPELFKSYMNSKLMQSMSEPGEAVGLLCSQSIGEPSTQMTLNTFHFAGRGEMNVTLGIPRLREILMVGSQNIKTPSMEIPVLNTEYAQNKVKQLKLKFNRVRLSEVLSDVSVSEYLSLKGQTKSQRCRVFKIRFSFLPPSLYEDRLCVTPASILSFMESYYFRRLVIKVKRKIQDLSKARLVTSGTVKSSAPATTNTQSVDSPQQDEDDSSDIDQDDGNAAAVKERQRLEEEQEYEDGEEESNDADDDKAQQEADDVVVEGEEEEDEDIQEDAVVVNVDNSSKSNENTQNARKNAVLQTSVNISDYTYDTKKQLWCEVTLQFVILDSKMDLTSLIEADAKNTIVHEVPNISRCLLSEKESEHGTQQHLRTEGINIMELYKYADILDTSQLYCNDIHAMAATFGIEAANKVITKEIQNVFAAYGIEVDYRHLSLLADYMTFEGSYKPLNRVSMETCSSPFQKMTFETTMQFLVNASIQGSVDQLTNPSSRLVVGRVVSSGSGVMELLQPLF